MKHTITTYAKIWWLIASNAIQQTFINRGTNAFFMFGKIVRLIMSLLFLYLIKGQVVQFAHYTTDQVVIFFLTYQFIDVFGQVFYRGVYNFSDEIRTGSFDFYLSKPINPLFRALTGHPDINDALFIIPTTIISIYIASSLAITITWQSFIWYVVLLLNSFFIVTALHIVVLVVGILTTEVDGIIWLYRDLMQLGRFPVSIYLQPLRFALFFIIPVGMMITIPSEVLLNIPTTYSIFIALLVGVGSLLLSLRLWNWGLKRYSSASS